MAIAHGHFVWYELLTPDPDAAQRFYSDVIGWEFVDAEMPDMDYRMSRGSKGMVGGLMQLTQPMIDGGAQPAWFGYVAVDNVDEFIAQVSAQDCNVYVPPTDIPQVGRFAMFADPQGVPIYVMTMAGDDASEAFHPTAIGHCAWNELSTPDLDAAIDFYTAGFGWTRGESMDMGEAGTYQLLDYGGQSCVGAMRAGDAPPAWRYYFRVASLADSIGKLKAAGGTVIHGPQVVPGDDEIVIALDPQGAMFCLVASTA